jgi:hypothetical protein|tara:strand:- start:323 stop:496 length:174 start_codon:yes stop_codon:yes gene_type:complete
MKQTRLEALKLAVCHGLEEAGTLLVAAAYHDYIEVGMDKNKKKALEQRVLRAKQKDK